jgi:hypothetical protein
LNTVLQGSDIRNSTTYFPSMAQACMGNEMTVGTTDLGNNQDVCLEPRTEMNNFDQGQWINRTPYQLLYGGIASANDALDAIENKGLKIGNPSDTRPQGLHTDRNIWWGHFINGVSHGYLGMLFDKSIIVPAGKPYDESNVTFHPYPEVLAAGIAEMKKAIELAAKAPEDTTPATWVNGNPLPKADAIRVMHSFIARTMVYGARNPAERAKVDWNAVIAEVDAGIQKDFFQTADVNIRGTWGYYKNLVQLQTDTRPSVRLYGPADTTGQYQAWVAKPIDQRAAISIATPDKRVSNANLATNGSVGTAGAYFQFTSSQTMGTTLGTYLLSNYRGVKYGVGTTVPGTSTSIYQNTNITLMTVTEMRLLKAEALIRLGRAAEAVPLINVTRVANGKLPPVTLAGPPQSTAGERASCVPRRDNGSCGDLMDALIHESRFENFGVEATIAWANARGWGKLLSGTPFHLPIPGRELQTLGLAYYTFGGPNNPGSAP